MASGDGFALDVPGLSGQYKIGKQLGNPGSFKTVYRLTGADGGETGKVIALLNKRGEELKSFFRTEGYTDSLLAETGGKLLKTDELVRLPSGEFALVMDDYATLGVRVGDDLIQADMLKNARVMFVSDPVHRAQLDIFSNRLGKKAETLSDKEFESFVKELARNRTAEESFSLLDKSDPMFKGLNDQQVIALLKEKPELAGIKFDVDDVLKEMGVAKMMPEEAQEATFRLMLKQAKEGIVNADLKPGNVGFRSVDGVMQAEVTDKGGLFLVYDAKAKEFLKLGDAPLSEKDRFRAALKMYATNTNGMAGSYVFGEHVAFTPGAVNSTFGEKFKLALRAMGENPNANIADILGGEMGRRLNAYKDEVLSALPAKNRLLDKMGQGVSPTAFDGRKGIPPAQLPPNADALLAVAPSARKAKPVAAAVSKDDDLAKYFDDLEAKHNMEQAGCSRISQLIKAGSSQADVENALARGVSCAKVPSPKTVSPKKPVAPPDPLDLPLDELGDDFFNLPSDSFYQPPGAPRLAANDEAMSWRACA